VSAPTRRQAISCHPNREEPSRRRHTTVVNRSQAFAFVHASALAVPESPKSSCIGLRSRFYWRKVGVLGPTSKEPMRRRWFLTLDLIAVLGIGIPASSQVVDQPASSRSTAVETLKELTPQEAADGQTDFWARTLRLTSEQVTLLHAINLRYATVAADTAKASGSDSEKLAAIEALEATRDAEMLRTLNPEQSERYLAIKQKMDRLVRKHIQPRNSVQ
jgi:hypothetical protein